MTNVRGVCSGRTAGLVLATLLGLSACERGAIDNNQAVGEANEAAPGPVIGQIPVPAVMSREDLLLAVVRAAAAEASGTDDAAAQDKLDGMRFEVALRFGCGLPPTGSDAAEDGNRLDSPAGGNARATGGAQEKARSESLPDGTESPPSLRATYDEASGTLRVRAAPDVDPADPFIAAVAGPETETVEGFWIPRPWLLSPACPVQRGPAAEPAGPAEPTVQAEQAEQAEPAEPNVAVAQFYGKSDSRVSQRAHRAYELVRKAEAGTPAAGGPFDLVLSGRLRRLPGGKVVNCIASSPNRPPRCVVSAEFGQVRIERAGTGETLGEWGGG